MRSGLLDCCLFRRAFACSPECRVLNLTCSRTHAYALQWRLAGALVAGSVGALGLLRVLPALGVPKQAVGYLAEATTGGIFALGLGLSGMLQPAKVAG